MAIWMAVPAEMIPIPIMRPPPVVVILTVPMVAVRVPMAVMVVPVGESGCRCERDNASRARQRNDYCDDSFLHRFSRQLELGIDHAGASMRSLFPRSITPSHHELS